MPVRWEEDDILVGRLRDIYWNNKNTNSSQQKNLKKIAWKMWKKQPGLINSNLTPATTQALHANFNGLV